MLGYIIYNKFESERNSWFINELIKYFNECNVCLKLLIEEDLRVVIKEKPILIYKKENIKKPDFVLNRTNNYLLSVILENMCTKVFNNSNVSHIANNKYLSYLKVSSIGINVLDTYYISRSDIDMINNFPVVIKPIDGKGGEDVYLCKDKDELYKNSDMIKSQKFIVQSLASDIGKDLRVYILGNKIYKSILRVSKNGFKSNYCLGNDAKVYELNQDEKKLVNKIIGINNFDYVGIDFLFDNGRLVFNEIEDSVGSRMLYDKTNLNVAYDLVKYIQSKI